jgi:predicted nucleotidyltransferase
MGKKSNQVTEILKEFKRKIEMKIKLQNLILFGSRARGNEKEDSDIDIIIVSEDFDGQKSFKRPIQFYRDWNYDYDTDIICLTPKELELKKKQVGIIQNAIKDGVIIA